MNQDKLNKFFSEEHDKIPGWFFPLDQLAFAELYAMQKGMRIEGDICEIGVYRGKSLTLLSILRTDDERLLGFDLFTDDDEAETNKNLQSYGVPRNTTLTKGLTSDISSESLDELIQRPVRFLHIDAGHEYHEVIEQLDMFSPYLADAGVIAMDDYQDREFPGIEAATLDFSSRDRPRRFVPFLAGGNKMFLCASWLSGVFQKHLLERPNFVDKCRLTRVRDFNVLVLRSKLPVASSLISQQIDRTMFPQKADAGLAPGQASTVFSQIGFGSGQ